MIVRGIWPGQIMSTHTFFFSDLMLQARSFFFALLSYSGLRLSKQRRTKKKMRNNKKWRHHWRQRTMRLMKAKDGLRSLHVIKVLTNGMLVILKKIESYDVRSDEKWRRNHWYLVVNRVKSHDLGKEGHFVRLWRRSVNIIKSTPIFKVLKSWIISYCGWTKSEGINELVNVEWNSFQSISRPDSLLLDSFGWSDSPGQMPSSSTRWHEIHHERRSKKHFMSLINNGFVSL